MRDRQAFLDTLLRYYREHGRHDLPWRLPGADGSFDPYNILVSEVMLQQTQVPRVIPKYQVFLRQFPTVQSLADAALGDVLVVWQGLGYNRRAKFLWQAARMVVGEFSGRLPRDQAALTALPGVGYNTAGAVVVYAGNEPALFIETNIRTVYIHHFFHGQQAVPDRAILELLDRTLDRTNPREFYWSLMDYGSHLKQTTGNLTRASAAYAKQSKFSGSLRQIRGKVLHVLAESPKSRTELKRVISDERLDDVLAVLAREGLIHKAASGYRLP